MSLPGRLIQATWVLVLLAAASGASAQVSVPPELRGWEDWVLKGHETHRCPWLVPGQPRDEERVCAWPAVLEINTDEHGGRFSQRWQVAADTWVALPGNAENWPEGVALDGAPAALVEHLGSPSLRLAVGAHTVTGEFRWTRRPEFLALPQSVALISLTVSGARVANPQRTDAGVTLGAPAVARQDDRAELRVFRLLDDDLPALLTTQLELSIAGEARELRLPGALPAGFVPSAIDGPLAARLDPDGTLRVQVRPGSFRLTLEARGPSPVAEVRLAERPAPWPRDEVWSFKAEDRVRVAVVEGATAVDPAQADVPGDWRELPAYRLNPTTPLRVVERSRGLSASDVNELHLRRISWLDFSGEGFTILDRLSGRMRRDWRLDMRSPYRLASARDTNSDEPLLITGGAGQTLSGVELRAQDVAVTALARVPRGRGALPASGWHARLASASGMLVLASGYRLIGAIGPDAAPQAWLERWRLLDVFAVLLIATVAWRTLGVRAALIALGAAALTYQEAGAPIWVWLAVLVALALERAAPEGRLRRAATLCRRAALVILAIALVPFVIGQARLAVYPQLEALAPTALEAPRIDTAIASGEAKPAEAESMFKRSGDNAGRVGGAPRAPAALSLPSAVMEEVVTTAARRTAAEERYEPGALVQAGPGIPDWRYHEYEYSWSGPVEENATVRFLISPPWLTRIWRVVGIALALLLVFELAGRRLPALPAAWRTRSAASAALLIGLGLTALAPPPARAASTPDSARLDELRNQLLEPPRCAPDCAAVLAASVSAEGARLSIVLTVAALDAVGVPLPNADPAWAPDSVEVDGATAGWVQRGPGGVRYVSLARGRHLVRLAGPLGALDALSLSFPLSPHRVDVSAPEWDTGGLAERHLLAAALQLARRRQAAASDTVRQEEFPPFVSIARLIRLGHDWTVQTTVSRVAPRTAAFTVSVPLLPQESLTTTDLRAEAGKVAVGLAAGQDAQAFGSILPHSDALELIATPDSSYAEVWSFEVAPTWHVDFSGVPPVAPAADHGGWTFEYYPRPGEHLRLAVTRPAAVTGGTLAFDRVSVQSAVGKRSSDTHVELAYRSTQGARHTLTLPADAVVTQVKSDHDVVALRPEHGELSLAALPGRHTWQIDWQGPQGAGLVTRVPSISQAAPASNLQLSLRLPEDRWILWVIQRGIGPTVLYWGELLVFLIAAWLLGRSRLTPLPARDWLLLGLGLSTFSWAVLALFVLFVAVFEWRSRQGTPADARRFQLQQIGCAVLAVAAMVAVVAAVPRGLLAHPDMRIEPYAGPGMLSWFVDQSAERLPSPGVISVSLWWYKLAMLAWALWLSFALTRWAKWAWEVFAREGLWREPRRPAPGAPPPPAVPATPAAP